MCLEVDPRPGPFNAPYGVFIGEDMRAEGWISVNHHEGLSYDELIETVRLEAMARASAGSLVGAALVGCVCDRPCTLAQNDFVAQLNIQWIPNSSCTAPNSAPQGEPARVPALGTHIALHVGVEKTPRSFTLAEHPMHILEIKRDLVTLGIDPVDYRVLKLLPLVYVAWADGTMEEIERRRILKLSSSAFPIGPRGAQLLHAWLNAPPSHEYIQRGLRDLLALARVPEELDVGLEELAPLLVHAEGIARSTARALDAPWAVKPEEEAALAEIARLFSIDNGMSWAALLRELDGASRPFAGPVTPPPSRSYRRARRPIPGWGASPTPVLPRRVG